MMPRRDASTRNRASHRSDRGAAAIAFLLLLTTACSDDSEPSSTGGTPATADTTVDPVAAAEARVATAQTALTSAKDALASAGQQLCGQAGDYVTALDRYGKLLSEDQATVGDVKTAGADLATPRESVSSAAGAVSAAQVDVTNAEKELAAAQAALADAKATASSVPASSTIPPSTTSTTLVPPSTLTRVQQAEADLATAAEGITDVTPLREATAEYNSAAFALEIAWLRLLADAGCLTEEQQVEAIAELSDYTLSLQTQLQQAGYYDGALDGVYGPQTVDAVEQLQMANGLPATGFVDRATQAALDEKLAAVGQQAADRALTQTAALQTILTLTGYWTGPIDGNWSPQLTDALKAFQTALGVQPSGAVDTATLAAFEQAIADIKRAATTTTTAPATTAAGTPRPPTATTSTTVAGGTTA
jgi:peptidoglycan hydrolase-like protein with peptidoglycan-binding domain